MALVARYHRQATPRKSHEGYGDLKRPLRRTVKALAAMLRLAEGLDRSHARAVTGLDLYPRTDDYLVRLRASGDAELELWAAHRHAAPLAALLGLPLKFEVAGSDHKEAPIDAEQADDAARVPGKAVRGRRHRRVRKDDAAGAAREVA
jgi:exopolyphosphatase/guanosine-5'-triphosphate,3'-diphosphate pyrophosphatase